MACSIQNDTHFYPHLINNVEDILVIPLFNFIENHGFIIAQIKVLIVSFYWESLSITLNNKYLQKCKFYFKMIFLQPCWQSFFLRWNISELSESKITFKPCNESFVDFRISYKELYLVKSLFYVFSIKKNEWKLDRGKNKIMKLLSLCTVGCLFVNMVVTSGLTYISSLNYPGGHAVHRLHSLLVKYS